MKNNSGKKTKSGAASVNSSNIKSDAAEIVVFTLEYFITLGICVGLAFLLR